MIVATIFQEQIMISLTSLLIIPFLINKFVTNKEILKLLKILLVI